MSVRHQMHSSLLMLLAALAACGGSDEDKHTDKDCSDFQYQEDSQAWHNSHPGDGLDADNDGIACEGLPNRPASNPNPPISPSEEAVYLNAIDLLGASSSITLPVGGYGARFRTLGPPFSSYNTTGVLSLATAGDGRRILSSGDFEWYEAVVGKLVLMRGPFPSSNNAYLSASLGMRSSPSYVSLAGSYRVLGHACQGGGTARVCQMTSGTASLATSGAFRFCPGNELSSTCPGGVSDAISFSVSQGRTVGAKGGYLTGSLEDGVLGYSARDSSDLVLYGIRDADAIVDPPPPPPSRFAIAGAGGSLLLTSSPPFLGWVTTPNVPLAGFMADNSGRVILRSSRLVIAWDATQLTVAIPFP